MRRSLGWPITLGVVMIVLVVILIVGWIIFTLGSWFALATGTVFLVLVLVGVVLYLLISIKEIRLNQRQSNFIDSVTHELKSPIASLKLYLQTLSRRNVSEKQQADFHRIMLQDVERLDTLINHLLDAARLDREPLNKDVSYIDLQATLRNCAETACRRYHLASESIRLELVPATVRARAIDVEREGRIDRSGEQAHQLCELAPRAGILRVGRRPAPDRGRVALRRHGRRRQASVSVERRPDRPPVRPPSRPCR